MKTIKLLAVLFISALAFTACSEDHDHDHDHDEELITTVIYTLTNTTNPNDIVVMEYDDPDGEDGSATPTITGGTLMANATYTGTIQLLNRTESPAEDVTIEVQAEGDEHEFFYSAVGANVTISKTDVDGDNNPLGIETSVSTGVASSGTLTVVLKHEPTKPNNGNPAAAGGTTDVEVTFNVTVQ
ncbi:MAG: type 1 periplasmic binding fold superfamily protein [Flavobacteriaceae bacterium]|nr:type 1 periplasmic binding fold superfamily protein [Flavobacteriaceae bacterium]